MRKLNATDTSLKPLGAWFILLIGIVWLGLGIATLNGSRVNLLGGLVFVVIGLISVGEGVRRLVVKPHLADDGTATITPDEIRPGDQFQFVYRRSVPRDIQVESIGVFLVFREVVTYHDGHEVERKIVDRLFQKEQLPGSALKAGDVLTASADLRLPAQVVGIRNPFMKPQRLSLEVTHKPTVKTSWVVKVRIRAMGQEDAWQMFELDVPALAEEPGGVSELEDRYDLFLLKGGRVGTATFTTMASVLPHLESDQISDLYHACPCLLLERLTWGQAEEAQAQLEATEAEVLVRPASDRMGWA